MSKRLQPSDWDEAQKPSKLQKKSKFDLQKISLSVKPFFELFRCTIYIFKSEKGKFFSLIAQVIDVRS
jgi:hypothetical protein